MLRIAESTFASKYTRNGNTRSVVIPAIVAERMGLQEGDYLDVTIRWPKTEEYDVEAPRLNANTDGTTKKRGRPKKVEE